jgi:Ca-activated chloride channel family protein
METLRDIFFRGLISGQLKFAYWLPSLLLFAIPAIIGVYFAFLRSRRWRIRYPVTSILAQIPRVKRIRRPSRHLPLLLRLLVIALVVLAAMRPQMGKTQEKTTTRGVDIVLTLDISPSMMATDFTPNRAEAAKEVLRKFVMRNQNDRIGLVVFSGMAFTQCPMTADTAILEEFIEQVKIGDVLQDGTAIGEAIVTSVARFPDPDVPSKVIILTTDGEHNMPGYDPQTAARIAARQGVRIYTIGVGGLEPAPIPDPTNPGTFLRNIYGEVVKTRLDEDTLRDVANLTGGRYYRATDETALGQIYDEISQLETHEIESRRYTTYTELFQYALGAALILLVLELISRFTWGRVLP